MKHSHPGLASLALALALVGLAPVSGAAPQLRYKRLDVPAPAGSGESRLLRGGDGVVYLSWLEPLEDGGHALAYSSFDDGIWEGPWEVARGEEWFVNWADVPGVTALADGTLMAWWYVRDDKQRSAYHIDYAVSKGSAEPFSKPKRLHDDKRAVEHGFASVVALDAKTFGVVWLDGRGMTDEEGATALMYRTVSKSGKLGKEETLDERVCSCCPIGLTASDPGMIAAYRDRSSDEVRDIGIKRFVGGKWQKSYIHGPDGWKTESCPVNGAHVASLGARVLLARYTEGTLVEGAGKRVLVGLSEDGGTSFRDVVQLDGDVYGRVSGEFFADGTFVASWLEKKRTGGQWKILEFRRDGQALAPQPIARVPTSRQSGRAQMARAGDTEIVVAWPEVLKGERRLISAIVYASSAPR